MPIVFVENALPTEIVDISIIKEKKNYIEATVNKYIKKAQNRIDSPCPYFEKCGGCDLLHINYDDSIDMFYESGERKLPRYS